MRRVFICVWVLAILVGCARSAVEPKRINFGLSSFFQPEKVNRIAIMPIKSERAAAKIADRIRDELTVQILKLDRFEVIDRYKVDQLLEEEGVESAQLTGEIAKKLGSKLKANAVIVGEIREYQPASSGPIPAPLLKNLLSRPPAIAIYLRMVSVENGMTIWTVSDRFDGGDRSLQELAGEERDKLNDVGFLITLACAQIAQTLNF
jgi:hypothetical protein